MRTYTYTIGLEPGEQGGYTVSVPVLPGCVTQGDTYEEAVAMAQDAILAYLAVLVEDGDPIPVEPQPSTSVAVGVQVDVPTASH